jgi:oxygen-dependent protoporphyrinogen oxidase
VAEGAGSRHVVRVSFGTQDEPPATEGMDEEEAAALALREASALLGAPLGASQLLGSRRERFAQAQPAATIGLKAATAEARGAIQRTPALGAVGAWLAGTGLAQVVPDAAKEAERVRRHVLFS